MAFTTASAASVAGDVVHDHIGARLTERNRDAAPDAGVGAGHQGLLTGQNSLRRQGRGGCSWGETPFG